MSAHEMSKHLEETKDSSGSEDKLIIALDFGTTYSGIAYCFANDRDCIPISVDNWPGAESLDAPKIPTQIRYDKNDPEQFDWGATVSNRSDGVVGVKLLLDPTQERPSYLRSVNIKKELKNLPKSPVQITADFIGAIYKHGLSEISKRFSKDYVDRCNKEHVLSVPAVWSDAAKNATLQAAELAGLSPIHLIKEPEAAALWTAKKMDRRLERNDSFVVCDAGGGTVDLISYQVEAALPRLQVKELVPGTGGMAGSLGLNKRFADAVNDLVGDEQWPELKKSKAFFLANKQFDREIKKSFQGGADEEYFVNFPTAKLEDDTDNGLESSTWTMTGHHLRTIFDPLVTDILRLITDQVQRVRLKQNAQIIKGIFLVGGFGGNQYLVERVRQEHPDIEVLQPPDAWAAIAKGAALSRVPREAIVTSTSSTRHYGVRVRTPHDSIQDLGQPIIIDRTGRARSVTMTWYINIGDDLLRDKRIKFHYTRDFDIDCGASDLIFVDTLYECAEKTAPRHPNKGRHFNANCVLTSDLSSVPQSKFKSRIDKDGIPYSELGYDLVVTLESAVMKFSLEIGGESLGSVDAKYN
ncbi:hypothetical protein BGZ61DRAFT_431957 [Ilyonectria robusta]|uniref:uncharacterized protein n=1 Tax=Ilyonectria robusta TaxID=1079257 RepID=UPI001E8CB867|nr:uncharacterized protein BGZ61DRAFT_431957 [Ilyonectria robusta]KAH8663252.1 hypothetical protein BGZ61DRAFT_431957 [Ilyonectria robusta]